MLTDYGATGVDQPRASLASDRPALQPVIHPVIPPTADAAQRRHRVEMLAIVSDSIAHLHAEVRRQAETIRQRDLEIGRLCAHGSTPRREVTLATSDRQGLAKPTSTTTLTFITGRSISIENSWLE